MTKISATLTEGPPCWHCKKNIFYINSNNILICHACGRSNKENYLSIQITIEPGSPFSNFGSDNNRINLNAIQFDQGSDGLEQLKKLIVNFFQQEKEPKTKQEFFQSIKSFLDEADAHNC